MRLERIEKESPFVEQAAVIMAECFDSFDTADELRAKATSDLSLFGLFDEDALIGYGLVSDRGDSWLLWEGGVASAHRGKGGFTFALRAIVDILWAIEYKPIWGLVRANNVQVRLLYERLRFANTGLFNDFFPDEPAVRYTLRPDNGR